MKLDKSFVGSITGFSFRCELNAFLYVSRDKDSSNIQKEYVFSLSENPAESTALTFEQEMIFICSVRIVL